jgi:hypothetical protein
MTKKLLQLNVLNGNGRMYTSNVVQEALGEYKDSPAYIESEMNGTGSVNVEHIIGTVSHMRQEEGYLVGDVVLISRCPEEIKTMVENDELSIRPFGMGTIDEHRAVQDYKLVGFAVTDDPS